MLDRTDSTSFEVRWPSEKEMRASAALFELNRTNCYLLRSFLLLWMVAECRVQTTPI